MLMTPMTPKVMARPMAASSSTEPSESPYQAFCTVLHSSSVRATEVRAAVTAACTSGGRSGGKPSSRPSESWSPRSRISFVAAILAAALDFGSVRMMAARACSSAVLTRASGSLASALSRLGSALASRDLNTACAAL